MPRKERSLKDLQDFFTGISDLQQTLPIECRAFVVDKDEPSLNFKARISGQRVDVTIICGEDYPDGTLLTVGDRDPEMYAATVRTVFEKFISKYDEYGMNAPVEGGTVFCSDDSDVEAEDQAVDDCVYLKQDVELSCKWLKQPTAMQLFTSKDMDNASVLLRLPIADLSEIICEAWGLNNDESLEIRISDISTVNYRLSVRIPTVVVMRPSAPYEAFPIGKMLERVAVSYMEGFYRVPEEEMMNPREYGAFFMGLFKELLRRLPTLSEHCVICDDVLPVGGVLPSVCKNKELCVFAYEDLGLFADFATLSTPPEVLDILLTFLSAALNCKRKELLLDPYPLIRDPTSKAEPPALAFGDSIKDQLDLESLQKNVFELPCAKQLTNAAYLTKFRAHEPLKAKLVSWVISSNRSYLVKMSDEQQVAFMKTPHQFLTVVDSPAKEDSFQLAKAANGGRSLFIFHGSPLQNWHSILRNGLVVTSGTPLMTNGAALGKGIYFSPDPRYSFQYSQQRNEPNHDRLVCQSVDCCGADTLMLRKAFVALAICEVVDSPCLQRHDPHRWLLTEPDHCCVRFLFIFDEHSKSGLDQNVDRLPEAALQQLRAAMMLYQSKDFNAKVQAMMAISRKRPLSSATPPPS